jgi:hypothetical protein
LVVLHAVAPARPGGALEIPCFPQQLSRVVPTGRGTSRPSTSSSSRGRGWWPIRLPSATSSVF